MHYILNTARKNRQVTTSQNGTIMDTHERLYIYKYGKVKQIVNEQNTVRHNFLF
jgi:D-arabinose 1-dehydrogenase-like Zn-dependent alcohol dehydrogenase